MWNMLNNKCSPLGHWLWHLFQKKKKEGFFLGYTKFVLDGIPAPA